MSRAASARSAGAPLAGIARSFQNYLYQSELPLTMLVFLLPMLVIYEVGTRYYAFNWASQTETRILAFTLMRQFLELFGATGRYLPAMAVIGILIAWHVARRDRWQIDVGTPCVMLVECGLLAIPLLALSGVMGYYLPLYAPQLNAGIVFAIGAGIYEELVFRLMAFTLLNIFLIDLLKVKRTAGFISIVILSSVLFAAYHHWSPQSPPFRWSDFTFRTLCGAYFGGLFMARGFAITAGAHAAYDIYYFCLKAASAT